MHDNATIHSSKNTEEWLKINKIKTIEWPPYSPDINPIENLWQILDQKVRKEVDVYADKDELWLALRREWYRIDSETIKSLYDSMTKRIDDLHKNEGGYTRYWKSKLKF